MARLESVAVGGYYPTPSHLIPQIASVIHPVVIEKTNSWDRSRFHAVDPCAGEGAAVLDLLKHIFGSDLRRSELALTAYTCELEETRFKKLREAIGNALGWRAGNDGCLHGDAFRVSFDKVDPYRSSTPGASLLYLNPPYDTDRVHGRLEQKFLDRFTGTLSVGGLLVFVVPFYALKASAELLGREYSDVRCFRFPKGDFETFKQVVLYAYREDARIEPDADIVAKVLSWASDASSIPEFPEEPLYYVPHHSPGLGEWKIRSVDVHSLKRKVRPWTYSSKSGSSLPVAGILPDVPVQDLLLRTYPLATPPRPAHIAAGIASGIFNGQSIRPNRGSKLPEILIKGVFSREYRTIEEKQRKDGSVKAVVQVQQPKLLITVLDRETSTYYELRSGTEATGSVTIESMNVADLLIHYSDSLMGVMERQCPVLYDPRRDADSIPLPKLPRKLFVAQGHAVRALVKLLGGPNRPIAKRRGKSAFLLGEIGSGKTSVALATTQTVRASRVLVMCPPHLLKSWQNEIATVVPHAQVRVIATVEDVQAAETVQATPDHPLICILSREAAKLAHAWESVGEVCPKCGGPTPEDVDFAKKRSLCELRPLHADDFLFREAHRLAVHLQPFAPTDNAVQSLLRGRFDNLRGRFYAGAEGMPEFETLRCDFIDPALDVLVERMSESYGNEELTKHLLSLVLATWTPQRIATLARSYLPVERLKSLGKNLVLLLPPGHPDQQALQEEFPDKGFYSVNGFYGGWSEVQRNLAALAKGEPIRYPFEASWVEGKLQLGGVEAGSLRAACRALHALATVGKYHWGKECGEHLFGAIPEPRRVSIAKHITRYYKNLFDFLILDECHEYASDGSAQERSAHRLTKLGVPTIFMTGTVMNGYAESLFTNMWAASPGFRSEFKHNELQRYIDRYGYRKRLLEDKDEQGEVVEFGSQSDRVTRSEKFIGNAPGILPLFLLDHLLPVSVTLHKSDLAIDLPPCVQKCHKVEPTKELRDRYEVLRDQLVDQIRKDMFEEDLSGKLFGQLAELPSYLDRATSDTGNTEEGDYVIRYPESVQGRVVASQPGFSPLDILPKERWMLDLVEKELDEGRNAMVFSWHVSLLPRLSRLLADRLGEKIPILYANKVATGKRQDWIDREIVKRHRRVLVTNPVAIQTGLNNLVHFATEVWMENPACNPVTYRQAIGRVDRIGQKEETRIYTAVYDGTLQVQLYDLLMKKVAVSVSTDGLDPESALQAAGLGEADYLAGLSIGKQIWNMLGGFSIDQAA